MHLLMSVMAQALPTTLSPPYHLIVFVPFIALLSLLHLYAHLIIFASLCTLSPLHAPPHEDAMMASKPTLSLLAQFATSYISQHCIVYLVFKYPVSMNTVLAGLFKALMSRYSNNCNSNCASATKGLWKRKGYLHCIVCSWLSSHGIFGHCLLYQNYP